MGRQSRANTYDEWAHQVITPFTLIYVVCCINKVIARTILWPIWPKQEKQPLLVNDSFVGRETDNGSASVTRQQILNKQEYMTATRERLDKHIPTESVSIRERTVLSTRSVPRSYREDN
jgi:hypothetical protein